jgi:hypothetical protein
MIKIYGSSDDLIEIEGDIREEFMFPSEYDTVFLTFSDGALLNMTYDRNGIWRISPIFCKYWEFWQCPATDDKYSDIASTKSEIQWVALSLDYKLRKIK